MFKKENLKFLKYYLKYTLSWKRFTDIALLYLFVLVSNDLYYFGDNYEILKVLGIGVLIFVGTIIFALTTGILFYMPYNAYPLFALLIIFGYDSFGGQMWVSILILLLSRLNLAIATPIDGDKNMFNKEKYVYILFGVIFSVLKLSGFTIIPREMLGLLFLISFLISYSCFYPLGSCLELCPVYSFYAKESSIREFLAPIVYWLIYWGFLDSVWYYVGLF